MGLDNLADRGGFEPPIRYERIHAFQACAFNRSATCPFSLQPAILALTGKRQHSLSLIVVLFMPSRKFQRPDAKTNDIASMQGFKFAMHQFDEMLLIFLLDSDRCSLANNFNSRRFIVTHDGRDDFA